MRDEEKNSFIFNLADIKKKNFEDRWVKFAFGPQGFKNTKSLNLGIVNFAANKTSLNHKHDVEEALYVLSGNGKISIAGKVYDLKEDDFVFIPIDTDHQIITGSGAVKILFIFGGEIVINH
jgi:quercetin dioxygenase-like cupin family protein